MMRILLSIFILLAPIVLFGQGVYTSLADAMNEPESVVKLDLRRSKIREWPEELKSFPNLLSLDLSKNKIDSLPSD